MAATVYADQADKLTGYYKVTFMVNDTKERLTRAFDSEFLARKFVVKLKHSKRCTLLSHPLFSY